MSNNNESDLTSSTGILEAILAEIKRSNALLESIASDVSLLDGSISLVGDEITSNLSGLTFVLGDSSDAGDSK